MSIWVILIEMIVFAAIFTAIIFTYYRGDRKYSPASIHNYPPDIQEEYFKTHERVDVSYRSKNVILTKGFGVLLFTCILLACALVAGAKTFWQGFVILSIMNLIDRFLIDEYWVGHTKAWIIPGTEDLRPYIAAKDKKKKWIMGTVGMALLAAILSGVMALILK